MPVLVISTTSAQMITNAYVSLKPHRYMDDVLSALKSSFTVMEEVTDWMTWSWRDEHD